MYHTNVNINSMVENVTQIKIEMTVNVCEKDYIWGPTKCSCKNCNYLGSIIDDSVITCDEIVETAKAVPIKTVPTKTVPTKSNSTNFYILLAFLSITTA